MTEDFEKACKSITGGRGAHAGIGTLGEKTLHAVLKAAFAPDESKQEVKIGRFYADIADGDRIIEIQTRNFNALRGKLSFFLEKYTVTVVYPIAKVKWLIWTDPETGEASKPRKSPKTGRAGEVFFELYKIKPLLTHPNFRLCLVLLELTEYRNLDGWSHDRKKGSSRLERIPERLIEMISIERKEAYIKLIPQGLPEHFTAKEFGKAGGLSPRCAQLALNVLRAVGTVRQTGKRGNAFVYEVAENDLQGRTVPGNE